MPSVLAAGRFTSLGVTFVRPGTKSESRAPGALCRDAATALRERSERAGLAAGSGPRSSRGRNLGEGNRVWAGARGAAVGSGPCPAGGAPVPGVEGLDFPR